MAAPRNEKERNRQRAQPFTRWAAVLKTLGHPVRLRIVRLVGEQRCNVSTIWSRLDLQQSVVSQHLAVLRKSGIVGCERTGTSVVYFISNRSVKNILEAIDERES